MQKKKKWLKFDNGISIQLLKNQNEFLGLGEIRQDGNQLRSGRLPMFVDIDNPYGVKLLDYKQESLKASRKSAVLTFSMKSSQQGPMEWQLHECRRVLNTTDWTEKPQKLSNTKLKLTLKPVKRRINGRLFSGFSYQYEYKSDSIPIYVILDRASWELGGRAKGNEFWWRSCFAPSIKKINSKSDSYSSEWYHPPCANPNILQFLPLQTDGQGFSLTFNKNGALMTWAKKVSHVRSLFEKREGKNEITHFHEHCDDLGKQFKTAPMEVLFSEGKYNYTERQNIFADIEDLVSNTLHKEIGMRRERIETYGQIEDWQDADLQRFRKLGLPKLLKAGMKQIYVANHFENNMNTFGVSNMCCTLDYKVAESVGEKNLKAFCDDAKKGGAKVLMWANTALSTLAVKFAERNGSKKRVDFLPEKGSIMEALEKADDPFILNTFGGMEADHYSPEFASLNLRDPVVHDYWMKSWKRANKKIGLEGIFLDSSFNLSSDKFHYCYNPKSEMGGITADQVHKLGQSRTEKEPPGKILSMYHAHLKLMVEMQQAGYIYNNEDSGVFGTHRHGPSVEKRADNLVMWANHLCNFNREALKQADIDADDFYFRGLAYRMMWGLYWNIQENRLSFNFGSARIPDDIPEPWHLSLFQAYNQVVDFMSQRIVLDDDRGVLYKDGKKQVLWAFKDFEMKLQGKHQVTDMINHKKSNSSRFSAQKHYVYLID